MIINNKIRYLNIQLARRLMCRALPGELDDAGDLDDIILIQVHSLYYSCI